MVESIDLDESFSASYSASTLFKIEIENGSKGLIDFLSSLGLIAMGIGVGLARLVLTLGIFVLANEQTGSLINMHKYET